MLVFQDGYFNNRNKHKYVSLKASGDGNWPWEEYGRRVPPPRLWDRGICELKAPYDPEGQRITNYLPLKENTQVNNKCIRSRTQSSSDLED